MPYQILPLKSADKTYGLAIVEPGNLRQLMVPEQQRLLETFTLLVANALERLTLTASEEQARLASERESIRNALLAALSHDLRTPLTVLFGQAEILTLDLASAGSPHARQASEIRPQVSALMLRLRTIVYNWMSGITGRVFLRGKNRRFSISSPAATKSPPSPAWGWGWRFAILS